MKKSDPYELMKKSNPYEMMKKSKFNRNRFVITVRKIGFRVYWLERPVCTLRNWGWYFENFPPKNILGMFYPDEDYSEIEMYKREFMPMMDDIMKNAKFVPQTVSLS